MKTIKQIADEIGVSKQAVRNQIANLGLQSSLQKIANRLSIDEKQEALIIEAFFEKPQTEQQKLDKQAERFCVYKHTVPNGKVYIGITSMKPSRRWAMGEGYKANEDFYKDIVDFGWDNIDHRVIASGLMKNDAEIEEDRLILEYKSYLTQRGYNKHFRLLPESQTVAVLRQENEFLKKQIEKLTSALQAEQMLHADTKRLLPPGPDAAETDTPGAGFWARMKRAVTRK